MVDRERQDRGSRWASEELELWARRHSLPEAYRVIREPASHGGLVGWQVTMWRSPDGWIAARRALDFFRCPAEPESVGMRLRAPDAAALVQAIERAAFWDEEPWADHAGLDGYIAYFEGWRDGRTQKRVAWTPERSAIQGARILFDAFARIDPSPLFFWRRSKLGG